MVADSFTTGAGVVSKSISAISDITALPSSSVSAVCCIGSSLSTVSVYSTVASDTAFLLSSTTVIVNTSVPSAGAAYVRNILSDRATTSIASAINNAKILSQNLVFALIIFLLSCLD